MASKNEAKIKFTAETKEYQAALDDANDKHKDLQRELKVVNAQMKASGESVESLEKKHDLLQGQLEANEQKTKALADKLEVAKRIFGENSVEADRLKDQLANSQAAAHSLTVAFNDCNAKLEAHKQHEKEVNSETTKLTNTIEKQQSEVDKLKKEYADVVLQHGKNSKEAKDLAKQIDTLSGDLKENKAKLNEAEAAADKLDNTFDDLGNTSSNVGEKMKAVTVGVAALGAAVVGAGKEAIDAFNEVDEGADNVIKATGATGEAAAELEQSYKNVASSIVGDFGNIGSALGEVNTRFGFTGSEAETATTQFLKFSEVTGMDATEAVKAVSRAIESAGLETSDYGSILDSLTAVGQATGVSVDTLATSLTDYGASLRGMGYDTSDSIAMLAQFEKAGVDSASVIRGMRTAQALWAKDGKNAKEEFARLVSGIKDGSVTAKEAYEAFGSKAGAELIDAIQSGRFSYEEMVAVVEGSKGALDGTFDATIDGGYELDLAMQNAKMAMAEAGEEVGTVLTPVFQGFSDTVLPALVQGFKDTVQFVKEACGWMKEHKGIMIAVASVIGVLVTAIGAYNIVQGIKSAMDAANVTTVWGLVAAHWAQATAAMAAIAPYILIVAAIAAVIAIIVLCVKYWDEIVAAVKRCWESVCATLSTWGEWINTNVIQPVGQFFSDLWAGITEAASNLWEGVKNAWSAFTNWINTNIIQPVINFFKGLWNGIVNVWNGICNAVQVAIMFIGSILQAAFQIITLPFRFIWENCKQYVFAAWEWIKTTISTAINAVKNVITIVWNAVSNVFTTVWNGIKNTVLTAWNAVKNAVTTAVNAVKTKVTSVFNAVKSTVTTIFNSVKSTVTNIWNGIKNAISNVVNGIKTTVSNVFNTVKTAVSNVFNGIKSTATNVWNGIKNAITTPIEAAKDKIKGIIDTIKGFFSNLKLKLPDIKMPHFKIEGKFSLNPPSVPKLKIDWYAQGGIMTKPTIFGMNGNRLMGGGEAGYEAIIPIEKLQTYIYSAVDKAISAMNIQRLAQAIELLANRPINIYVNGRKFAEATAGDSDAVGGIRNVFKNRGLEID